MRSRGHIALSITLVAGCEFGLGLDSTPYEPPESDSVGPCAGQALCIAGIDPSQGPTAGGTTVTISGVGFDSSAVVKFGAAPLETTLISGTELRVVTPPAAVEAAVDVTVQTSAGEVTANDAFLYTNTPTGDDTGGGGNAGLVSGLVESSYLVVGCPACFSLTDYLSYEVGAVLHTATRGSWLDGIPAQGSCLENPSAAGLVSTGLDVGEWVYLSSSAQSQSLRRTTTGGLLRYSSGQLESTDYLRGAAWDLSIPDAGVEIEGVLRTPSGFDSIEPLEILNDSPRAFSARLSPSRASFTWAPADVADGVVVDVAVYNPNGTALLGEVVCHTTDSGAFQVPPAYLSAYPSGGLVAVQLYRLQVASATDPRDGSTVEGVATFGVLGTATLGN